MEAWPQFTRAENFVKFGHVVFEIQWTDRHTDRHIHAHRQTDIRTCSSQYFAPGGEVTRATALSGAHTFSAPRRQYIPPSSQSYTAL